jgi:protocatechuate 3,4-dioxygenase beta subunit
MAYLFSDSNGRFIFETEWPNLTPPHIHFIVTAEGYDTLETQWVGDARQNEIDFTMVLKKKVK